MWTNKVVVSGTSYRVGVLMSSCDSPARSKLLGLVGITGRFGCPFCFMMFRHLGPGLYNCVGDHAEWVDGRKPLRLKKTDDKQADMHDRLEQCANPSQRSELTTQTGFHMSPLRGLTFAPVVSNTAIDVRPYTHPSPLTVRHVLSVGHAYLRPRNNRLVSQTCQVRNPDFRLEQIFEIPRTTHQTPHDL